MKTIIKILCLLCLPSLLLAVNKPDLFLLKTYDDKKSVVGWVKSEKLDGIRGFWNGEQLLTRGGQQIMAPDWFVENYPPFSIDGELWTKRGNFEEISSIVRRKNPDERWHKISHQIFEVPNQDGGLLNRLKVLRNYLKNQANTPIKIIKQYPITHQNQVKKFLRDIVHKGGEGVVVRNPNTAYQTGRLSSALKVKQYFDTECVVTEILPGKGKYTDKMGSPLCKTKDGTMVKIGSGFTDVQRENPPTIGTSVTFKYYDLTKKGKFKYPVFLRVRP
ncbi:DNA ligase [Bathymodiolus septemdierum thioautotrophic gill symbiont]|uniref:DNA ligase (ATP) n=1 Tax=endosymbiont of Bathymodiolus septemdierum str. Myojin knoll TaxID=1303921 RepID=A0A0P0UQX4_9GAMM|nr:DNA ligase [Bathymodiolus septemdierum thioautotrophic gill symbiont]BAS67182.1 DNA ligase (ATP) [endosymbiont of Bathymodiolus septemdierum str. Myojin knoll]